MDKIKIEYFNELKNNLHNCVEKSIQNCKGQKKAIAESGLRKIKSDLSKLNFTDGFEVLLNEAMYLEKYLSVYCSLKFLNVNSRESFHRIKNRLLNIVDKQKN